LASIDLCWINFLIEKICLETILDANDREEGIKNALLSAENARKEINLQADNQRILQEARMERDNMLKDAREIKEKMIADSKDEAQVKVENDRTSKGSN
jgi:F-type H+-transporting ATPase subunit b